MNDHLRAGDADRDRVARLLGIHFAAGRMTADEFGDRLAAALAARTIADLRRVLADLPGMEVTGMPRNGLERGYRRLLAFYPARYRRVHEDEMLAVLMTAAAEDRSRPGLRETADLIIGALRVWCQPTRKPGWRRVVAIVAAGAVAGLLGGITAGLGYTLLNPPLLSSSALVALPSSRLIQTQVVIAKTPTVLDLAQPHIHPAISEADLARHVQVSNVTSTILQFTGSARTAAQAESIANEMARSYLAFADSPHSPVGRIDGKLLEPATVATGKVLTPWIMYSLTGLVIGLLTGTIIAVAISWSDRRLRKRGDIAGAFGLPG
jgi:hypothetical protein